MRANNRALEGARTTILQAGGTKIYFDHPFLRTQIKTNRAGDFGVNISSQLKLEDEVFRAEPTIDFSKMEYTIDGGAVIIVNSITAGKITARILQGKGAVSEGDFIECAKLIQATGDTFGGRITTVKRVGANTMVSVYKDAVFVNFPFEVINGNAVAEYPVTMYFGQYVCGIIKSEDASINVLPAGSNMLYNLVSQMEKDSELMQGVGKNKIDAGADTNKEIGESVQSTNLTTPVVDSTDSKDITEVTAAFIASQKYTDGVGKKAPAATT